DPATALAPANATPAQIDRIREYLGLSEPLWAQFWLYLQHVAAFDLGTSIRTNQPVLSDILVRLPASVELAAAAFLLQVVIALPIGILAAVRRGSRLDLLTRLTSSTIVGLPVFWVSLMFLWIFSFLLGLFPLGGRLDLQTDLDRVTGFVLIDALLAGRLDIALEGLHHLVLPALALALPSIAFWTRLMRGSLLEVLGEDYVRTARAKGLSRRMVVMRHGVRNAMNPMVTVFGLELVALLTGALLVEIVFAWPGVGNYIFGSLQVRDYPVVQGSVILIALLYVGVNSIVDIVQARLDPRVLAAIQARA
ncbi:MAG: ABC transporter permease, partial [Chloroflexi bacterium]|nr:ABC transporter permease [Chloroflexota bacterium]